MRGRVRVRQRRGESSLLKSFNKMEWPSTRASQDKNVVKWDTLTKVSKTKKVPNMLRETIVLKFDL